MATPRLLAKREEFIENGKRALLTLDSRCKNVICCERSNWPTSTVKGSFSKMFKRQIRWISLMMTGSLAVLSTAHAQSITSFDPEFGQVGQQIIVYGSGFAAGVSGVRFNGVSALSYAATSDSVLYVIVPAGATSGLISVITTGNWVFNPDDFTVIGPHPYIDSFSPPKGPGGTVVTVEGAQFQNNVTAVLFNGTNAETAWLQSDTRLFAIPAANVTTGPITVVGNGTGSYTTPDFFYVSPVIDGFTPASGRAGETLTIDGINFIDASEVRIGNITVPIFNVNGNTQIVATVPSGAISGQVGVTTPGGVFETTAIFSLLPSITGFSPPTGTTNTTVTIFGANLNVSPVSATFNGVAASVTSATFNQIIATAPASSSGHITVTTGDGSVTSPAVFFYPPSIGGFSPGSGGEGTVVSISGSSFTNASSVLFDGVPALTFSVSNNASIHATAPNSVSTGPLTVTAPGGVVASATVFYGPATFTGFLPSEGFPGTDIILFGSNFEDASAVAFNGTPAPILSNTGIQIGTRVPTNATSGFVSITTPAGTVTSASVFTVPGVSDLRVNTFLHVPNPVSVGEDLTLTIVPSNDGPNISSNVTASVMLAPGLTVKSASTQKGTVNTNGNPVVFSIGSMTMFENPTLNLVLVPQGIGPATNTVTLASSTFDPNSGNNTDVRVTSVIAIPALSIDRAGASQVRVAWPVSLTNFILQSTPTLTSDTPWSNVSTTPTIDGDERVVTEPSTGEAKLYRLKN